MRALPRREPNDTFGDEETYNQLLQRAAAVGLHKPRNVPADQAWFWTPEWLEGEIEASEDIAAGRVTRHDSDEEFLESLRERADRADAR